MQVPSLCFAAVPSVYVIFSFFFIFLASRRKLLLVEFFVTFNWYIFVHPFGRGSYKLWKVRF